MKAIQINKIQGVPDRPSETVVAQIRLLLQNCEKNEHFNCKNICPTELKKL